MNIRLTSIIPSTEVKTLTSVDFPKFFELEELVAFKSNNTPNDHAPPHWTFDEFKEYLQRGEITKGIYIFDKLIAFFIFHPQKNQLYITEIGVHPDYREKGLGKWILSTLEGEAENRDLKKCSLSVDPYNANALNLYLHYGYMVTDYKSGYFGEEYPNTDRFLMEKNFNTCSTPGNNTLEIKVSEVNSLKSAFQKGYIGTALNNSSSNDPKKNILILKPLNNSY